MVRISFFLYLFILMQKHFLQLKGKGTNQKVIHAPKSLKLCDIFINRIYSVTNFVRLYGCFFIVNLQNATPWLYKHDLINSGLHLYCFLTVLFSNN